MESLILESKVAQFVLDQSSLPVISHQVLEYNQCDSGAFKCQDVLTACQTIYGFMVGNNHCYISFFKGDQLHRYKCALDGLTIPATVPLVASSLAELAQIHIISPVFKANALYLAFTELELTLSQIAKRDQTPAELEQLALTYRFISRKRYGQELKLGLPTTLDDITDFRQLVGLLRGIFMTHDFLAVTTGYPHLPLLCLQPTG